VQCASVFHSVIMLSFVTDGRYLSVVNGTAGFSEAMAPNTGKN